MSTRRVVLVSDNANKLPHPLEDQNIRVDGGQRYLRQPGRQSVGEFLHQTEGFHLPGDQPFEEVTFAGRGGADGVGVEAVVGETVYHEVIGVAFEQSFLRLIVFKAPAGRDFVALPFDEIDRVVMRPFKAPFLDVGRVEGIFDAFLIAANGGDVFAGGDARIVQE